ncbi:MAG: Gfo/Idh/MocA family oxidoreductase [Terricaulis sp.]|nr:Gfo/Idh/MocA family oxidoreductase [Terricaulis sp.]
MSGFCAPGCSGRLGTLRCSDIFISALCVFAAPSSPPAQLDWDFYCGPAPLLPYRPDIHPIQWRAFEAFGNGYMGDIGVHFVDLSRWMLGLGWPRRIASAGGAYVARESASDLPDVQTATFAYDHLLMTWTNRQWGRAPDPRRQWGTAIHGERGTLFVSGEGYEYAPREGDGFSGALDMEAGRYAGDAAMPEWERPLQVMTRWHMRDFLAAIAARRAPAASIEDGAISTSCCVLANIALRLGRTLEWDAENQRVIGDDAANALLARPYRAPWRRPAIA